MLAFQPGFSLLWTLSLLLHLRLADDLTSLNHDRQVHPARVLSQWEGRGPYAFLFGLSLLNALPLWNRPLLPALLYLVFLLTLFPVFPSFVRYALLVAIVDTAVGTWTFETLFHAGLVAIAASAFELGHDPFSGLHSRWIYGGLVLLPCVSLGWIPLGLACLVTACSAVALLRLLSSSDRSPTRRFLCAASPYLSVALISATLFSWKG